jgi:hypothetical protein
MMVRCNVSGFFAFTEIFSLIGNWVQLPGKLISISSSADGNTVWGVNRGNQIYRWVGNNWQQVDGGLKQVSVSHDGKWVVGTNAGV